MQKEESPSASAQPDIFQGRRGFGQLEHFDRHFIKNTRKKGPIEKHFEVFSPRYYILNGKSNPRMDTMRAFYSKIRTHFFNFLKNTGEASPLVARQWVWLNMQQHPWTPLFLKMFGYARALNIPDHYTGSAGFWRCPWF